MGLKIRNSKFGSLFLIVTLLLSQVFFIDCISSDRISGDINSIATNNSNVSTKPLDLCDTYYSCRYIFNVEDLVIAHAGYKKYFLDISKPKYPKEVTNSDYIDGFAYTKYGNIILFGHSIDDYINSIMKIDLDLNPTQSSEIVVLDNYMIRNMYLTKDYLFSYVGNESGFYSLLIHNATNIDDLTLLGNTTLTTLENHFDFGWEIDFVTQDNYVYFLTRSKNLIIYEINSTYQLNYIKEYTSSQKESVYFYDNYLFICDNFGLQIYNYSNPMNLVRLSYYGISSAQSIRIKDGIGYLATSDSFTVLDLRNIMDIQILDQYFPGDRENTEMWRIELTDNLALVLTKQLRFMDYSREYGGYLYIFDITHPNFIRRLYPRRIPLITNEMVLVGVMLFGIPSAIILTISILLIIGAIIRRKKKKQNFLNDKNLVIKEEVN